MRAKRPPGRVLVDYNQNALGATLASVYSVRPTPFAGVSMPVTWQEVERGIASEDFHIKNAVARIREKGDLFAALVPSSLPRFDVYAVFSPTSPKKKPVRQRPQP